jgi:phosphohistidine swiveling domain-containing protein
MDKDCFQKNIFFEVLDGYSFQPEGGRAAFYFFDYLLIKQYSLENKDWPIGEINTVSSYTEHNAKWFRIHRNQTEYSKVLENFIKNPRLINKLFRYLDKNRKTAIKILPHKDFSSLTNEELIEVFSLGVNYFYKILRPSSVIRMIDLGIISEFKKVFANNSEVIPIISANQKISFALSEETELLALALWINKKGYRIDDLKVLRRLSKIRKKYCFSELGYYNEKIKTESDYLERLNKIITDGSIELKLKQIKQNQKNFLKKRKEFLKTLDKRTKVVAKIASEISFVKDFYKYSMNQVINSAEPLFVEISNRTNRTIDYLKDLSPEEIKNIINRKPIDEKLIAERISNHVLITFKKQFYVLLGADAETFKQKYLSIDKTSKVFKGRCASMGQVKGKAKVILCPKDFDKMENGDILVVMNTSPDFTPILKKAAAIVAEEGGLTAHVSIVSREMKIPAVVGVAHITEILKDSDLVEVDAASGIIRKL